MTRNNLQSLIDVSNSIKQRLEDKINASYIINIYTNDEVIKLGPGSNDYLSIDSIIALDDDFLTIEYESHETDIMYNSIIKIEYYYR